MSPSPSGGILGNILGFFGAGRAAGALSDAAYAGEQGTLGAANMGLSDVQNSLAINSPATIAAQNNAINNVQQFGNYGLNLLGGNLGTAEKNINPFIQNGQYGNNLLQLYNQAPPQFQMAAGQGTGGNPAQFNMPGGRGPGGNPAYFTFQPTQQQLEQTPGYQFQKQEGLNAIQNQSSAGGAGIGSNQDLTAAKYATGLASQNYEQAFQNAAQTYGANNQAYNQAFQNSLGGFGANVGAYNSAFQNAANQFNLNQGYQLQGIGMEQNAGLTGTGQANQALLGFGLPAAQQLYQTGLYGGNAIQNTARLNAEQGLQGNEFMANLALPAAQQAGAFALEGAGANAAGILGQYNNLAGGIAGLGSLAMGFL